MDGYDFIYVVFGWNKWEMKWYGLYCNIYYRKIKLFVIKSLGTINNIQWYNWCICWYYDSQESFIITPNYLKTRERYGMICCWWKKNGIMAVHCFLVFSGLIVFMLHDMFVLIFKCDMLYIMLLLFFCLIFNCIRCGRWWF